MKAKAKEFQTRMNRTEAAYADHLSDLGREGKIRYWIFEPVALILADRCRYHPDFLVVTDEGLIEFHEVKGFWRDDARVKIKVAARTFPFFTFRAIQKEAKKRGGGWKIETIKS